MGLIKKKLVFVCLLMLLACFMLPLTVWAGETGSVTIIEQDAAFPHQGIQGIKLSAYRIAAGNRLEGTAKPAQDFKAAFDKGIVSFDADKLSSAKTVRALEKYAKEHGIKPALEGKITDVNGKAVFSDVPYGIYLIVQSNTKDDFKAMGYTAETESYIVEIPSLDAQGNLLTDIVCRPKCKLTRPVSSFISIDVYKEWKDKSNFYKARPDSIVVGLFKEGESNPVKKAVLSAKNNWHVRWSDLDKNQKW